MPMSKPIAAGAALALLCACEGRVGPDAETNQANVQVSAEGKAEEGKISIKAPGFDLAISLPEQMANEARADRDSKILYPGSTISGLAVAAGPGGNRSGESEVEMRFTTTDPLATVLAWYRDPARSDGFRLEGVARDGDAYLVRGIQNKDRHPFKVRLTSRAGGGTDGRLTIHHRG